MNKFIEILIGLILLILPIYVWIIDFAGFGESALIFLKGGLLWAFLLIGITFLLIGLSSLKED